MTMLQTGLDYGALYSIVCAPEIANRIDSGVLMRRVIEAFNAEGVTVNTSNNDRGQPITTAIRSNQNGLITPDRSSWDIMVCFRTNRVVDSLRLDDVLASMWNTQFPSGGALPTGASSGVFQSTGNRPGSLFAVCSQSRTRDASAGFLGTVNPWATPNYYQLCSQYTRVNPARASLGSAGTVARLISSPVVDSSTPSLVGTNPLESTSVGGLIEESASKVASSINNALGMEGGGVNVNDLKVFAYGVGFLVGALVVVKLVKEVKGV